MRIGIEAQRLLRMHKHGMDMVALHLIESLPQVAPQHEYIVFVRSGDDEEVLKRLNRVVLVYVRGISYADWEQIWLPLAIAQNNIDVMHYTSNTASLYCPVPYVLTLHDVIYLESTNQSSKNIYQRLGALYRKWVVPVAVANAAKVVTVSNYETTRIEQLLMDTKTRLSFIYNAIDENFANNNSCTPHIKSKLPEKFIFFLGNTDPKKNTHNVLLSFIQYRKTLKGNLPLVVGDFSKTYLKKILRKHKADELYNEIITLGYIRNTDLPFIYRKATFFLYPSLRESFGIPILESMACGCPVITSSTSAMPEIAGDAAMLVNPEDMMDISSALLRLEDSDSERNLLSKRGLEQVKKYSWKKSAQQYELLFNEIHTSKQLPKLLFKMRKITFPSLLLLLAVFFTITRCQLFPESESTSLNDIIGYFDFRTTQDVSISIFFTGQQNSRLPNVPFEISTSPNFENNQSVFAQLTTGAYGTVDVKSNLPTIIDSIYVRVNYPGVTQLWKASIVNSNVDWNQAVPYNENISASKATSGGRVQAYPYTIQILGTWNSNGLPSYLLSPDEYVDPGLLARINESVPEYRPVPTYNPEYLTSTDKSLFLNDVADVWVTFVHEGAGYRNTLGFYVYDKNNPPKTANDIKTVTIIYPNTSFSGSGGQLNSGNKVHIGRFNSGQAIGWVLFANAFSNGTVGNGSWALYSNLALNSFIADASKRQHNVLLQDVGFDRIILCFEDIRRDQSGCDNDFNDAIFFITTNPVEAAVTNLMPALDIPIDADGDGVTDRYDEYPTDKNKAHNQYFPAINAFNSLSYEDLWPSRGDYDFNDLVMGYNVHQILNSANQVAELKLTYEVRAVGGSNALGFAVHLPISKSLVNQVTVSPSGNHNQPLEATGVEAGQSQIVVPLFDDAHQIIKGSSGSFTNTQFNTAYIEPKRYTVTISFNTSVSTTSLGTAPFDSFIYVNGRSTEVHLPNKAPTDKADMSQLGTNADRSLPAQGKYYMNSEGKPWVLLIPGNFDYPAEKENIEQAYTYFSDWAKSTGTTRKDWYGSLVGYRNVSKIYKKNL